MMSFTGPQGTKVINGDRNAGRKSLPSLSAGMGSNLNPNAMPSPTKRRKPYATVTLTDADEA